MHGRVYIEEWETFFTEAEKLYTQHPAHVRPSARAPARCRWLTLHRPRAQTRYVVKYRHCDGKLVLKVTNDRVCLKFATDQAQDAKRMEKLNNLLFSYMCGKDPHQEEEDGAPPRGHAAHSAQFRTEMSGDLSFHACRSHGADGWQACIGKYDWSKRWSATAGGACDHAQSQHTRPGAQATTPLLRCWSIARSARALATSAACTAAQRHLVSRCCQYQTRIFSSRRAGNPTVTVTDLPAQARRLWAPRRLRAGGVRVPRAALPTKREKGSDDETGRPRTLRSCAVQHTHILYGEAGASFSCSPAVSVAS